MQGKEKIRIFAIGRLKSGPEAELQEYYRARLSWPLAIEEMEEKRLGPEMKEREGLLLANALVKKPFPTIIALDERGKEYQSRDFAAFCQQSIEKGHVAFLIGGADGLSSSVKERATHLLSLGRMTWPHKLARIMLLEQLYRAGQILAQHPYHRD